MSARVRQSGEQIAVAFSRLSAGQRDGVLLALDGVAAYDGSAELGRFAMLFQALTIALREEDGEARRA